MDLNLIALLCALAKAAYQGPATLAAHATVLQAPDPGEGLFKAHFAVLRHGAKLVVVFRGTRSLQDWVTNIHTGPAPVADGVYAHRGYWRSVDSAMPSVLVALNRAARRQACHTIYLTGHSKGGGEAILAYLWWAIHAQDVESDFPSLSGANLRVVTFGAPLVILADQELRQEIRNEFEAHRQAVVNYVVRDDIVPKCLARRLPWRIREGYVELIPTFAGAAADLLPAIASAAGSLAWQGVNARVWGQPLSMESLVQLGHAAREAAVCALAYLLERVRTAPGPRYVPVGRFVQLSEKGRRELGTEEVLAAADTPPELSPESVWDMVMHHYPEVYQELLK